VNATPERPRNLWLSWAILTTLLGLVLTRLGPWTADMAGLSSDAVVIMFRIALGVFVLSMVLYVRGFWHWWRNRGR